MSESGSGGPEPRREDEGPARDDGEPEREDEGPEYCTHTSYEEGDPRESCLKTGEGATGVEARVWDAIRQVEDPEMPVSIVDLGLVYGIEVEDGHATVRFTLTYTGCPARDYLLSDVERAARSVEGVDSAEVELVWSPPWTVEMVTDAGRKSLREFGVSV
jgi:metal-sulfur cluster biosynthetic enzyme